MRLPAPRTLLLASLVLFGVVAVGILLTRPPAPRPPAPPPPPAPVRVVPAAFGALVSAPGSAVVRWGPAGARPLLWRRTRNGRTRLTGLLPATRYVVLPAGRPRVAFTTRPAPPDARASVGGGILRVDGAPFFPLVAWEECPDRWAPDLHDGIDLFGGNPCTGLPNLLAALGGRALAAGTADDTAGTTGPGLIGWFYPDEADARGYTGATLPAAGPGLRFLTVTAHFFSGAAPLPAGRGMYPGLVARADVVGFDLYPLQELCRPELLPWVYDAQVELRRLAPGKPTFQWIEEREMRCPEPAAAVTPATIRVESWLAVAGGATGLAFFPPDWSPAVGAVVHGVAARIRQLAPALLTAPVPVRIAPAAPSVRASARLLGGAVYVIAVNAGTTPADVSLALPQLADRTVLVAGRGRPLQARSGTLAAALPPRTVRIYVAPPVQTLTAG